MELIERVERKCSAMEKDGWDMSDFRSVLSEIAALHNKNEGLRKRAEEVAEFILAESEPPECKRCHDAIRKLREDKAGKEAAHD